MGWVGVGCSEKRERKVAVGLFIRLHSSVQMCVLREFVLVNVFRVRFAFILSASTTVKKRKRENRTVIMEKDDTMGIWNVNDVYTILTFIIAAVYVGWPSCS